ncbi:MAG: polysaccharide biosynthesis/export family protein [Sedimentitalea sp.]
MVWPLKHAVLGLALATAASGEPYQLTIGDTVSASLPGAELPRLATVDLDGVLRFPGLAQSAVLGLSVNEAEQLLETHLADGGLYVDPDVTLSIAQYAPIVVAGDVRAPGSFAYLPQLTVELALSLAGGTAEGGLGADELAIQRAETEGQLKLVADEIVFWTFRIARLRAELAGQSSLSAPMDGAQGQDLLALERESLRAHLSRRNELSTLWLAQMEELNRQITLLNKRLKIQSAVIATRQDELVNARSLSERGLQRGSVLSAAERSEAEARARVLEIETQLSQAQSERSSVARARANFLSQHKLETLDGLQQAAQSLDVAQQRQSNLQRKSELVWGSETVSLGAVVQLMRRTKTGMITLPANASTPVLPGDALILRAPQALN